MNEKRAKRLMAKARSFVLKLTNKEILEIIDKCGYKPAQNLYDDYGNKLPTISKFYDEENDEFIVEIKCTVEDDFAKSIFGGISSSFGLDLLDTYNSMYNSTIVWLKDFSISELSPTASSDELSNHQKIYAQFMYNLFGEFYRKKYNQTVRKNIKEQEKENTE